MSSTTDSAAPALFFHSKATYDAMLAESREVQMDGTTTAIVYEGRLTELITSKLYLSTPYYSAVTKALKAMGCITQLRRGGGSAASQWEMIREPTVSLYMDKVDGPRMEAKTTGAGESARGLLPSQEQLAQQVRDLASRLGEAEEKIDIIIRALPDPEE